jgi:hypothetical protein
MFELIREGLDLALRLVAVLGLRRSRDLKVRDELVGCSAGVVDRIPDVVPGD